MRPTCRPPAKRSVSDGVPGAQGGGEATCLVQHLLLQLLRFAALPAQVLVHLEVGEGCCVRVLVGWQASFSAGQPSGCGCERTRQPQCIHGPARRHKTLRKVLHACMSCRSFSWSSMRSPVTTSRRGEAPLPFLRTRAGQPRLGYCEQARPGPAAAERARLESNTMQGGQRAPAASGPRAGPPNPPRTCQPWPSGPLLLLPPAAPPAAGTPAAPAATPAPRAAPGQTEPADGE